jgi:hypothetical protein
VKCARGLLGASTCWLRTKHPAVISAGIAESASIHARVDMYEYDQELATALRKLSPECEAAVAATSAAVDAEWEKGREARTKLKLQVRARKPSRRMRISLISSLPLAACALALIGLRLYGWNTGSSARTAAWAHPWATLISST